jgi:hypothetical protein
MIGIVDHPGRKPQDLALQGREHAAFMAHRCDPLIPRAIISNHSCAN